MLDAGAPSRVFAALSCGQEHVSAEAARLLVRLWNPAAAFTGCPTWRLGGRASTSALHRDNPDAVNTAAELAAARSAKVQCLSGHARYPFGRITCATLMLLTMIVGPDF